MSNIFTAVCRVTRDAEVRYSPSGMAVLNVNVANNQGFKDKQKTMFIRVAVFGKKAEGALKDYLLKGQEIMVSGELSINEYQAKDGTTKTSLELNATVLDLIGGKKAEGGYEAKQTQAPADADDFDMDIPFN
jgi:single-strand DNA-binding protein